MPKTHCKSWSPAWRSWVNMRARCDNPSNISYPNYGGKGISYCEAWKDFDAFYADMGDRPPGHSLDRKHVDKDYGPDNCKWSTKVEQNRDKRREITFQGETKSIGEWAAAVGLKPRALWMRIFKYGWTVERALTTPTQGL